MAITRLSWYHQITNIFWLKSTNQEPILASITCHERLVMEWIKYTFWNIVNRFSNNWSGPGNSQTHSKSFMYKHLNNFSNTLNNISKVWKISPIFLKNFSIFAKKILHVVQKAYMKPCTNVSFISQVFSRRQYTMIGDNPVLLTYFKALILFCLAKIWQLYLGKYAKIKM